MKTLYIDLDCIATYDTENSLGASPITFSAGVFKYLAQIKIDFGYALLLCTSGSPRDSFLQDVERFCRGENITFDEVLGPAELSYRLTYSKDQNNVFITTPAFPHAENFDINRIFLTQDSSMLPSEKDWAGIFQALSGFQRKATVIRKTSETDIKCFLSLDGTGVNHIKTGLGFFDHMLQQIARHGNVDLNINVEGDLHIDEHHTIEDVGLALGAAFNEALGNKRGIERYGFLLPMDDCLAQVAIDFGGRPWLMWEVAFHREKVGDMPTEMFHHFFKSFSDTARCNLNIKAEGSNEHHKIESIFKAFAKSIAMAVSKTNQNTIPSTKGTL